MHELIDQIVEFELGRCAGIIYTITNVQTGQQYVGATSRSLRSRWKRHRKQKTKSRSPLYQAMCLYGTDSFKIEAFASCLEREAIADLERLSIEELHPVYNRLIPQDIWSP